MIQKLSPSLMGRRTTGTAQTGRTQRIDLARRPAKVIAHGSEYLCLMEGCSTTDIELSFLHASPCEARLLLQTETGITFPIERVWLGKSRAGYRFASEVKLEDFSSGTGSFNARPIRLRITANACILDGNAAYEVELRNLSQSGAQFESDAALAPERLLGFSLRGLQQTLGVIRWEKDGRFGMKFQQPLSLEELATAAFAPEHTGEAIRAFRAA